MKTNRYTCSSELARALSAVRRYAFIKPEYTERTLATGYIIAVFPECRALQWKHENEERVSSK